MARRPSIPAADKIRPSFDHADQDAAYRAGNRTEPAEHRRRKCLQSEDKADIRVNEGNGREQHTCQVATAALILGQWTPPA